MEYWRNILEQVQSVKLPTDFPKGYSKGKIQISKPFEMKGVDKTFLLSVLSTLIMRYSAEENISFAIVEEDEKKSYLLHVDAEKKPTFKQLKEQVAKNLQLGSENVEKITMVQVLEDYYNKSKNESTAIEQMKQLMQVSFSESKENFSKIENSKFKLQFPFNKVLLHFHYNSAASTLEIAYKDNQFDAKRIQELTSQIKNFTQKVSSDDSLGIYDVSLITEEAKGNIPNPYEDLSLKWEGAVHEHFERQTKENPKQVAIIDKETITYEELNKLSNQLARHLLMQGLKQGETVAILGHRSAALVWAIMSILKAGCAFTILDPVYPGQRIIECITVAAPSAFLLISDAGQLHKEVETFIQSKESPIRFIYSIRTPKQVVSSKVLSSISDENLNIKITQDDVAVCTFTSGSTGIPKAVMGRHGPLTHYYPWMTKRFKFSSEDRFSMQSGIAHDPLQRDIFTPLFLGATIYVPDPEKIQNPGNLAIWFRENKISVTCLTPAMGQLLATKPPSQETILLPELRWAFFVGDVLTKKFVGNLSAFAKNCGVINMYGSTETQRSVSYFLVPNPNTDKEEFDKLKEILPIGKGMGEQDVQSIQIVIATRNSKSFQVCGIGEMGEIFMRSPHMSKGYRGKEEETKEKFIINPGTNKSWDKMYRTGDLGRYLPNGDAVCLGRADDQIKIRGFRIELGEINSALNSSEYVKESCTIVRTDLIKDEKMIVSYVVLSQHKFEGNNIVAELKKHLRTKLPIYMIPAAIVVIDKFPLTPNAKIKKEALPKPSMNSLDDSYIAPRTDLEKKLVEIWMQVLNLPKVGIYNNFFDLGGHSIIATTLVVKVRQEIKEASELPVESLYKCPTIASMGQFIEKSKDQDTKQNPVHQMMIEDTILEENISSDVKKFEWNDNYKNPATILLTGSTGFLGTFLLSDLLKYTSSKIYCLVRSENKESASKKIVEQLKHHLLYSGSKIDKVVPVVGDFAQPLLGLKVEEYQSLASKIDVIIHNGALVHWMYPYEKLKPANVIGTREVIKFAYTSKIKPIHYVSTTSVFDSEQYSKQSDIFENTDLPFYDVKGGYPQSKYVAEKLIMNARKLGVPTCIYRPGYITGHSKTGVWNPDDFLCRMIKGCLQLGAYPDLSDTKLDMSPVDFVSGAIVELFRKKESITNHGAYHLVNPNEFFFNSLFVTAERLGYSAIQKESYLKWKTKLFDAVVQKDQKEQNALYPMLTHFTDDYDIKMRAVRPWYDNSNTLEGLSDSGITCPPVLELIGVYYGFLCQCGFIELPKELSQFAKQKKYFEFAKSLVKDEEAPEVNYKNLMRKNRIDSTDQLSEY